MLPILATLRTAKFWIKATPYVAIGLAVLAGVLWVRGMQHTIAKQDAQINTLTVNLKGEQENRKRDVAGLSALSGGLAKVAVDTKKDQAVIQESVKNANAPLSPQLSSLLDGLRAQTNGSATSPARRSSR